MISQTVEYALRAVVCLARASPEPRTNDQLAELSQVPPAYLPKVMLSLRKAGLIDSRRGPHGGNRLARPADSITLLEVVNAVEPIRRIQKCPLGLRTHSGRLCALHTKLDAIAAMTERALRETTLADVLLVSNGVTPFCDTQDDGLIQLG